MSTAAERAWFLDACAEPLRSALYRPLGAAIARDGFVIANSDGCLDVLIDSEDGHQH